MPARRRRTAAALALLALLGCGRPDLLPNPDPSLRGMVYGDFYWALTEPPTMELGAVDPAALRDAVGRAADVIDDDRDLAYDIAAAAVFPSAEAAEAEATRLRELLAKSAAWYEDPDNNDALQRRNNPDALAPLTPPERDTLKAAGVVAGERGFGWGGDERDAPDAITTVENILVVTGLKSEGGDAEPPAHPLKALLEGAGARVMLEGDRFGEGAIVGDLSCTLPDEATAARVHDDIGDGILADRYLAMPPWITPPTEAQALARASIRRWQSAALHAMEDPEIRNDLDRLVGAAGDPEQYQRILDEMERHMAQRVPKLVEGPVDVYVITLLLSEPDTTMLAEHQAWLSDLGDSLGQLPIRVSDAGYASAEPDDYATTIYGGTARRDVTRLDLAGLSFARFSRAGLLLFAYLEESGCADVRFGLVDYDEIRVN